MQKSIAAQELREHVFDCVLVCPTCAAVVFRKGVAYAGSRNLCVG